MSNNLVSYEELIISNMLEIQAMIRILQKRGLISQAEILEEVQNLKSEMEENMKKLQKEN